MGILKLLGFGSDKAKLEQLRKTLAERQARLDTKEEMLKIRADELRQELARVKQLRKGR